MSVINLLSERAPRTRLDRIEASIGDCDPYGIDVQLSLYVCYELHYRGFAGVDPEWEWSPALLHLRARLEEAFLTAVHRDLGEIDCSATEEIRRLSAAPGDVSRPAEYLRDEGTWQQMREYFAHRSVYHLKEGDPHAWAIPRLSGQAKASLVAAEFHGCGAGRGDQVRQRRYADLMDAADLDSSYLAYIDRVPAAALAVVNLMSLFGLHRSHRGAAIGYFAAIEITSSRRSRLLLDALDRLDAPGPCREFYREHLQADAVHEQAVRSDVVGELLSAEPHLGDDVVFGMRAFELLEERLGGHLLRSWRSGDPSLRRPLSA